MKIALCHLSLNFLGGEEHLCLSFIKALKWQGHNVALFTVEKTNWDIVSKVFGNVTRPDEEAFITEFPVHDAFKRTFVPMLSYLGYLEGLFRLISKRKYDVIINTYGDMFNSIADIAYVHFPIIATLEYQQTPAFTSAVQWKVYTQAYRIMSCFINGIRPSMLLANSKFTQQAIRKYLHRDSLLLHPPVEVQNYLSENSKRKNYVITVSKFTPKRRLHKIPLIAQRTHNAKFIISGIADQYSFETIRNLHKLIKTCNVKDRVTIIPNAPRSTLIKLLQTAKVYLHAMPFEHFGISIIEAMAAGCVPLVHRSGGPWIDILDQQQGKNGFSYATIEEAAQTIDHVMHEEKLYKTVSSNAQKRAAHYDIRIFEKRVNTLIKSFKANS
ncbi:glycosyltransferase [Candidatus Bathyarchaeota archaeon]|nr:glycosyltransferase [Candidatus Bathyarchaeota archaeon]